MISDIDKFVCNKVNKITLYFKDGSEVVLEQVFEWDFNFERCDSSYIDFKTYIINKELFNRFCVDDSICFIYIEIANINVEDCSSNISTLDIQCNMRIRSMRTNGDLDNATEMYVSLEGAVK